MTPKKKASLLMKKVSGTLSAPAMIARCGPKLVGMMSTSQAAIASTMPVPLSTPVSTDAAKTSATTDTTLEACALS